MAENEIKVIKKEKGPDANIAFVGEGEPFKFFNTATGRVSLPEDQSRPFYHEKAELIIQTWPMFYKPIVNKGE